MSTFAFLPRSVQGVGKTKKAQQDSQRFSRLHHQVRQADTGTSLVKRAEPTSARDIQAIFSVALSRYSLDNEPGLRYLLETSEYVPLSRVMQESSVFRHLPEGTPETRIVSALRELPQSNAFDLRIGRDGFEILFDSKRPELIRTQWEQFTIYVENLPVRERTFVSVHHALASLLSTTLSPRGGPAASVSEPLIQHISFPAGRYGKPGAPERYRGCAFIVLQSVEDANRLAAEWPWIISETSPHAATETQSVGTEDSDEDPTNDQGAFQNVPLEASHGIEVDITARVRLIESAKRSRFRTLPKITWLQMKEEYLAEQRRLLAISRPATAAPSAVTGKPTLDSSNGQDARVDRKPLKRPTAPSANFPSSCLILARSLPEQTNKTALKALFSTPLGGATGQGVDYVDWSKGMDSCHVRMQNAEDALKVLHYFNRIDEGTMGGIHVELVQGERERLYWDKVPEHLKLAALKKAGTSGVLVEEEERDSKRRRK